MDQRSVTLIFVELFKPVSLFRTEFLSRQHQRPTSAARGQSLFFTAPLLGDALGGSRSVARRRKTGLQIAGEVVDGLHGSVIAVLLKLPVDFLYVVAAFVPTPDEMVGNVGGQPRSFVPARLFLREGACSEPPVEGAHAHPDLFGDVSDGHPSLLERGGALVLLQSRCPALVTPATLFTVGPSVGTEDVIKLLAVLIRMCTAMTCALLIGFVMRLLGDLATNYQQLPFALEHPL